MSSVWDIVSIVQAIATFLLLCTSLSCYTLFQSYFFSRAPVQRTVINSLIVNLSFILEILDTIACSYLILPHLLPMVEFLTHHPMVACVSGSFTIFLGWVLGFSLAVISVHRLLTTLFYGQYEEWSQNLMISISLTVVYGYPLLVLTIIHVVGYHVGDDTCASRRKYITSAYNITDDFLWQWTPGEEIPPHSRSSWLPTLATFIIVVVVVVIANVSIPLIKWRRR